MGQAYCAYLHLFYKQKGYLWGSYGVPRGQVYGVYLHCFTTQRGTYGEPREYSWGEQVLYIYVHICIKNSQGGEEFGSGTFASIVFLEKKCVPQTSI